MALMHPSCCRVSLREPVILYIHFLSSTSCSKQAMWQSWTLLTPNCIRNSELLDWFRRKETSPYKAQLICTLQNLSILDSLEKDEVFIVEKSRDGATRTYSARDVVGLRRDGNLQAVSRRRFGRAAGLRLTGRAAPAHPEAKARLHRR